MSTEKMKHIALGVSIIVLAVILTQMTPHPHNRLMDLKLASSRTPSIYERFREGTVIRQGTRAGKPNLYCSQDEDGPLAGLCKHNLQYVAIGMVKCGSATLHKVAYQNPHIRTHRGGEMHFFDSHRNISDVKNVWYAGLGMLRPNMPHKPEKMKLNDGLIYGEHTPSYIWQINYRCNIFDENDCIKHGFVPNATSIINKMRSVLNPDTQMVITIRDPVARAYSHFAHFSGCPGGKYQRFDKPQCFHDLVVEEIQSLKFCFEQLGRIDVNCLHHPMSQPNKGKKLVGLGLYAIFFKTWHQHFPNMCVLDVVSHGSNLETVSRELQSCLGLPFDNSLNLTLEHASQSEKFDPMMDITREMLEHFYRPYNQLLCHMVPHTCNWAWVKKSFDDPH